MGKGDFRGKESNKGQGLENNPQNINRNGRPPKLMSKLLLELSKAGYERVTPALVLEAYEYLLGLDSDMLQLLSLDLEQPRILQIVSREMLSDKSSAEMLETMLDRAHGKALVKQALQNPDGTPLQIITFTLPDNGRDPT